MALLMMILSSVIVLGNASGTELESAARMLICGGLLILAAILCWDSIGYVLGWIDWAIERCRRKK